MKEERGNSDMNHSVEWERSIREKRKKEVEVMGNDSMADPHYVAAMLANGVKYAQYEADDIWMTEWGSRTARMVVDAMENHPDASHGNFDELEKLVRLDGGDFAYDEPPITKSDKAMCYRVIMRYVDELRQNGFVANKHYMTEDFREAGAMFPA